MIGIITCPGVAAWVFWMAQDFQLDARLVAVAVAVAVAADDGWPAALVRE